MCEKFPNKDALLWLVEILGMLFQQAIAIRIEVPA